MSPKRAFLLLRYTLIAATAYLLLVEEAFRPLPTSALLLITLALLSNVAASLLPARLVLSLVFAMGVLLCDTIWITAVLLISDRFTADFFYIYFFVLLLAAIGENLLLIAVGAVALCGAYVYGHLATGGSWSLWNSPSLIRIPFLFATAVFYGFLVDRARQERHRAEASEEVARQLSRALAELRVLYIKAQEADRIKAAFLATVSHEFLTPLAAVIGYVDLLLEHTFGPLQQPQRDALMRAQTAGRNLHRLIAQVLEASGLDLARETTTPEEGDLNTMFNQLRVEFADPEQVTLRYPQTIHMPPLYTDVNKLRTILHNLIENAIKFTPAGLVTVEALWDAANDEVEVRVSDTGIGMLEADLPRIFEAFRQGADHTEQGGAGVGLGLYIVRRLLSLLGGRVAVDSKVGSGSTFTVRFPRVIPTSTTVLDESPSTVSPDG